MMCTIPCFILHDTYVDTYSPLWPSTISHYDLETRNKGKAPLAIEAKSQEPRKGKDEIFFLQSIFKTRNSELEAIFLIENLF
jgi:hypothetical protein